jgi:hypothetical protein
MYQGASAEAFKSLEREVCVRVCVCVRVRVCMSLSDDNLLFHDALEMVIIVCFINEV